MQHTYLKSDLIYRLKCIRSWFRNLFREHKLYPKPPLRMSEEARKMLEEKEHHESSQDTWIRKITPDAEASLVDIFSQNLKKMHDENPDRITSSIFIANKNNNDEK